MFQAKLSPARVVVGAFALCGMLASSSTILHAQNKIVIDGSTTVGPIAKAFAEYAMKNDKTLKISVSESGSGNGAKSLVNGACDVAAMSRLMKDTEFKAAVDKGALPVAHVIALDGIAIVVHPGNPVKDVTLEQIKAIYTGKINNWKDLGGPDAKIVKISRDTNSGTYESFEELAMHKEKMAADIEYVGSNGAIRQRIQSTPAAIGYVGIGFLDKTVKALPVNGVKPDRESVTLGKYPIARPLFLFTNGYPKLGSPLYTLLTLHLTKKGQEIIQAVGFVPLTKY